MTKICLTCSVNDKLNKNKIPKWYYKIGNESLLPPILNNNKEYSMDNKKNFEKTEPELSDINVSVNIENESPNKWLFYWASDPQNSYSIINDPIVAYNNEDNHGLVKTDKNGNAKIILNCPQPYKVNNITYPRHVHFTLEKNDNWDTQIKTYIITCNLNKEQFKNIMKENTHIVLNALSGDSYNKYHIPDTYNLPYESLNKLPKAKKKIKIKKFVKNIIKNYPDILKLVESKKLNILDVPIITYCANKKCNAGKKLTEHFIDSGFTNILEYPGGNEEFKKNDTDKKNTNVDNLNIEYEILVYKDKKYIHNIKNNNIEDKNGNIIGKWNNKDIIFSDDDNETSESNLEKLKDILNNSSNVNKEKTIDKQDVIIVKDRNYISKEQFNEDFNGWGFTFF